MFSLIRSEWRLLLFGFLMTFWSSPGQTFFISLFSGEIRGELELSDGQFGSIYSLATLMSAVAIIWTGSLVDSMDLRKFSILTIVGLAVGCVMLSISPGVLILVAGIFLLRQMGQGLMCLTSSTAMVRYLEKSKGKATALSGMGYAVSEAITPFAVVSTMLLIGWRSSWMLFACLLVAVMIPCVCWLLKGHESRHAQYLADMDKEDIKDDGLKSRKHWTRYEVLHDLRFYIFVPGLMSQQIMFTGFIFHQVHLVESKNWSLSGWAALFSLYAIVSVLSKLVVGVLVDKVGTLKLVPWISVPMGLGLIILGLTDSLFWGGIFLVLMGITVGYQTTISAPFWAELYGTRHLGAIKSLAAFTMVMLTATSPVIIGWFIDFGVSIETLAIGAAGYVAISTLLSLYGCWLTYTKDKYAN